MSAGETAPGLAIECPRGILRQIANAARKRISKENETLPGLLFGEHAGQAVRVRQWRASEVETDAGRLYSNLNGQGEQIARLIERAQEDEALKPFEMVGWFVARESGELALTDSEMEVYQRWLPHTWQVALAVRCSRRAGGARFFGRTAQPPAAPADAPPVLAWNTVAENAPAIAAPARRRWTWLPWTLALLGWASLAGLGATLWLQPQLAQSYLRAHLPEAPRLGLVLSSRPGTLSIQWDANSPAVAGRQGKLQLWDGGKEYDWELDADGLKRGQFAYALQNGDMVARLSVENDDGSETAESVRFVAPVLVHEQKPDETPVAIGRLERENRRLRDNLQAERDAVKQLEQVIHAGNARARP